ncbi:Cell wall integrity and stress response component 4 [Emydomyces testavorans]|uniref:Cell wall integrity and stress response component 4 n=1 Tax=Emydomyces testavorans TaxID=2070801 RepID=A0AAF0IGP0_9EURO|nr:Cell wall integrity and stress response component 4 [Emydomyces testavorans]
MAYTLFVVFASFLIFFHSCIPVKGIGLLYCSSLNTGSDFDSVISDFQSNGACRETCVGSYAFAILQGKSCWCSNAAPGDNVDTDACSDGCPGYPKDKCGSTKMNLYGYIQLDKKPTTTIGGSTTTTSSVSTNGSLGPGTVTTPSPISDSFPRSSIQSPLHTYLSLSREVQRPPEERVTSTHEIIRTVLTTVIQTGSPSDSSSSLASATPVTITVTESQTKSSTTLSTIKSSSATTVSSKTSSKMSSTVPPTSQTPIISTQTIPGGIATITVPIGSPSQTSDPSADKKNSLNGGKVAGIIIGVLAASGILLALVLLYYQRRRKPQKQKEEYDPDFLNPFYERPVPTPVFRTPLSGPPKEKGKGPTITLPAFTDSRLKADVYPNGSRHSNVSLQDNQDYSRPVLRLTNPDPPEVH